MSASDALSQHRFGAAASSHLKDESLQQQRRDKRQRCLGHCRGNQWESPAELMLQLDEARRHIDQLLWQIHDLTEEIGRLEMEIASLEDSN